MLDHLGKLFVIAGFLIFGAGMYEFNRYKHLNEGDVVIVTNCDKIQMLHVTGPNHIGFKDRLRCVNDKNPPLKEGRNDKREVDEQATDIKAE